MNLANEIKKHSDNKYLLAIANYLQKRCLEDEYLLEHINNSDKDLNDCFKYITSEARKKVVGNCAMIEDQEVYDWAVHFYLESTTNTSKDNEEEVEDEDIEEEPVKKTVAKTNLFEGTLFDL